MDLLTLTIPYPPTINHYLKQGKWGRFLSPEAKAFKAEIKALWFEMGMPRFSIVDKLKLEIYVYHPDNRKRDISNIIKIIEDALQDAGFYDNDYRICELHVYRMSEICGKCEIKIERLNHDS